ncbi:unnamed protein product [Allacma fusca]|uniref:Transmembrane protein 53 n=1 Tax=Allacma fusca TaxID=39272 RepID=A0A8J2K8V2_9HEXA|nr:unnamed protein product [Allacma fusca]
MSDNEVPDMDLDFHVEFPTPGESGANLIWPVTDGKEEIKSSDEEKSVLVVLIGWAGAQDKHLAKYSDIYLKRGCIVLRYTAPLRVIFYDTDKFPVLADRFVRLLKDLQLQSHPIFFHVFSNGGSFLYSYILKEISAQKNPAEFDLRGTIFDSAPVPRNIMSCYRAFINIFSSYNHFKHVIAGIIIIMLMAQVFWHHVRLAFRFCIVGERIEGPRSSSKKELAPLQDWLTRISKLRSHAFAFMYSEADVMIPWQQVEKVAGVLRDRGNSVKLMKFVGSEHVQHFRMFPEEYIATAQKFIRNTMENYDGPTKYWDEFN